MTVPVAGEIVDVWPWFDRGQKLFSKFAALIVLIQFSSV